MTPPVLTQILVHISLYDFSVVAASAVERTSRTRAEALMRTESVLARDRQETKASLAMEVAGTLLRKETKASLAMDVARHFKYEEIASQSGQVEGFESRNEMRPPPLSSGIVASLEQTNDVEMAEREMMKSGCDVDRDAPAPIGLIFNLDHSGSVSGLEGAWESATAFARNLSLTVLNNSFSEQIPNGILFTRWAHPADPGDICPSGKFTVSGPEAGQNEVGPEDWLGEVKDASAVPTDPNNTFETNYDNFKTCIDGGLPATGSGIKIEQFNGGAKFVNDVLGVVNAPVNKTYYAENGTELVGLKKPWTCWVVLMSDCGKGPECVSGTELIHKVREECLVIGVVFGNYGDEGKAAMANLVTSPDWLFEISDIRNLVDQVTPVLSHKVVECAAEIKQAIEAAEERQASAMEAAATRSSISLIVLAILGFATFMHGALPAFAPDVA